VIRRITLTLHDRVASELRAAGRAGDEIAGVLIVGVSETAQEIRLLGREFHPAPPGAYLEQTPRRLRLSPAAYMPALSRADEMRAAALFVHTHPVNEPVMSRLDDGVDEDLRSVFQIRTGSRIYGSLVFRVEGDALSFSGRVWRDETPLGPITRLRELGKWFRFSPAIDAMAAVPVPSMFERHVRAFGPAMQDLLGRLHIGIVGCGGTGSAVAEQLIRLGVGKLTVVDYDTITDTNITRVYGSGIDDVGAKKIEVLRRHAARIGLGAEIVGIDGTVVQRRVADALRDCEIVFGCTDDHSGRLVLAKLAYWFLIPVIDIGARIYADEGVLSDIVCRMNVQVPGAACAQCWGVIDSDRVRAEHLTPDELRAQQREGYAPGLDDPDPAVIAYTTLAAAMAVHELITRLTRIAPMAPDRVIFLGRSRQTSSAVRAPSPGHWCGNPGVWGTGMTRRFLDQAWTR
jgi:hypothetical protein